MAVGNAAVALAQGAQAGYWNPAALAGLQSPLEVSGMYSAYFGNIVSYLHLGVARPVGTRPQQACISLNILRVGVDGIPYTMELVRPDGSVDWSKISEFSVADYGVLVSMGMSTWNWRDFALSAGVTFKVVHRRAGHFARAWGFGLDAGAVAVRRPLRLGVVFRDVVPTFTLWSFSFTEMEKAVLVSTGNAVPLNSWELTLPRLEVAVAWEQQLAEGMFGITPVAQLTLTTDGKRNTLLATRIVSVDPAVGVEAHFRQLVWIRAGIYNMQRGLKPLSEKKFYFQPTVGAGLWLKRVRVDYALLNPGTVFSVVLPSHVVSVSLQIDRRQ